MEKQNMEERDETSRPETQHTYTEFPGATEDTYPAPLNDEPYLAHALVRTAKLWSFLHASAPLAARRYLVGRVADALGVEVTGGIW